MALEVVDPSDKDDMGFATLVITTSSSVWGFLVV
jgi:hypothetical protein